MSVDSELDDSSDEFDETKLDSIPLQDVSAKTIANVPTNAIFFFMVSRLLSPSIVIQPKD